MKMHIGNFQMVLYIRRNITLTFADVLIGSIRETNNIQTKHVNEVYIQDSRFKYIYSSKLHDFNMDWYIGIGYEQFSNFIHVSFL